MVRRSDAARPVVLYRPYELLITQEDFAPHRLSHVSAYGQEGGEDVKMSNSNFLASHSGLEHGLIAQSC